MKILKFNVLLKLDSGKFFNPLAGSPYLSGIRFMEHLDGCVPVFSDSPIFYSFRDSRFLKRELRRAGFNAFTRPAVFFLIKRRLASRQAKAWK